MAGPSKEAAESVAAMQKLLIIVSILMVTNVTGTAGAILNASQLFSSENNSLCGADCSRCAADGCIKCVNLLRLDSNPRQCVDQCSWGMVERWSADERFMGRVCSPAGYFTKYLIGGCVVATLGLLVIAVCGIFYKRYRIQRGARRLSMVSPTKIGPEVDPDKLFMFHQQLEALKPHASTFLKILNDTRSQVRFDSMNGHAGIAYTFILSDLSKLLIVLNKKDVPVIPASWPELFSWATRLLSKYNEINTEAEVTEFMEFLLRDYEKCNESQEEFNWSPSQLYSSSSMQCLDSPPSYSLYSLVERDTVPLAIADPWRIVWIESVEDETWIEDETVNRLRRPDELTTEL